MKTVSLISSIILIGLATASVSYSADGPKCTEGEMWEYVVNNAYRIADEYATDRNPRSTFIGPKKNYSFVKQFGGEYKGKYLLLITNEHGRDISFAVLLPLFDENEPSDKLDDSKPLWKVGKCSQG